MAQIILITGASTGFGALAARALAKQGHTVFAGMYSHDGNTRQYEDSVAQFAQDHKADLRTVTLDLLNDESVKNAVKHVLDSVGRLDVVVHNAGHMSYGPAESFTPQQFMRLFDINVVGTQRLNQAVLPHMRQRRQGHLVWIGSSSVYGAKSPMLAPYFAAKAAMDNLAQSYAGELSAWGIETTIVQPGVFTKGTNHFTDAAQPGLPEIAREYEEDSAPTKGIGERTMAGTGSVVPEWAEPSLVADALVKLAAIPRGKKPFRITIDPVHDGGEEGAAVVDLNRVNMYRRFGIEEYLQIRL